MAEKWLHEINLRGAEDIDALIGYAEGLGFSLEAAASEKDNGQDWPNVRDESHREQLERVVDAAIALVEAETAPPLVGVPSRDQPWTQAKAKLAAAVEEYRAAS